MRVEQETADPKDVQEARRYILAKYGSAVLAQVSSPLKWTSERPTVPGWYWITADGWDEIHIVYFRRNDPHMAAYIRYCGPIAPPPATGGEA